MSVNKMKEKYLDQIKSLQNYFIQLKSRTKYDDFSDLDSADINKYITMALATIERISGRNSVYHKQATETITKYGSRNFIVPNISGIAEALKSDLENDYLSNLVEIIHSDIFSDYLEMADYLLKEGFKDAAAVISGSSLEVHLRNLCGKYDISLEKNGGNGIRLKKADELNSELAKKEIYTKSDQKSITAWLGLRNNAAHGNYDEYTKEQVMLFVSSIRDFMNRVSA